jgi:hypothetical protein
MSDGLPASCARVWIVAAGLLLGMFLSAPRAFGQPENGSIQDEYLIKAAFLYGFGQNVDWPDSSFTSDRAPFVIGILGKDPFGGALQEIARKKTIQGKKIKIREFAAAKDFREPCHILFIPKTVSHEEQRTAIEKISRVGLLTVGESPGFAEDGGIVNLYIDGDSVRFELNLEAARRAKLRMDAQLQKLSKPVADRRKDGGIAPTEAE